MYFLFLLPLLLFIPITFKIDNGFFIRLMGRYFSLSKRKKKSMRAYINSIKNIISYNKPLNSLLKRMTIYNLSFTEIVPFNPYLYVSSYTFFYSLKAFILEHCKGLSGEYFHIINGDRHEIKFQCMFRVKVIDIIIVSILNFRKIGELIGTSHR